MAYEGHPFGFTPGNNHANLKAQINKVLGAGINGVTIENPMIVALIDADGDAVFLIDDNFSATSLSGTSEYQIQYQSTAQDPCFTYLAAGNLEEICW